MTARRRLSDAVTPDNVGSIAASLRKYGYTGPCEEDAVVRWLLAQGPDIDTEVAASAGTAERERRPEQRRFRRTLLEAYGGRCVLTGCDVEAALEAAHVADWRCENDAGAGILLRADLHRLLERGLLVVDAGFTVRSSPAWYRWLEGRRLRLPANRLHWPRRGRVDGGFCAAGGARR